MNPMGNYFGYSMHTYEYMPCTYLYMPMHMNLTAERL